MAEDEEEEVHRIHNNKQKILDLAEYAPNS